MCQRIVTPRARDFMLSNPSRDKWAAADNYDVNSAAFIATKKTLIRLAQLADYPVDVNLWMPLTPDNSVVHIVIRNKYEMSQFWPWGKLSQTSTARSCWTCLSTDNASRWRRSRISYRCLRRSGTVSVTSLASSRWSADSAGRAGEREIDARRRPPAAGGCAARFAKRTRIGRILRRFSADPEITASFCRLTTALPKHPTRSSTTSTGIATDTRWRRTTKGSILSQRSRSSFARTTASSSPSDGYLARDYTGFYGGSPYDVRIEGGDFDFGENFLELVAHIDSTFRTLTTRRYRATSGLSMGGFMSLYLSARYPDLIGSASSFNPGPEFYVGEKGRRSLWRPKDHVANHEHTSVRLIRASGDYISQYHEETRAAYAASNVDFEYRQDEYHRHWATSIGETFEFHAHAFANPAIETIPVQFNYTSPYRSFEAWGYRAESNVASKGFILLEHVRQGSLRVRTRRWAPDGPAAECSSIAITTAPLSGRSCV